jgi:hypothetical protein
MECAGNLRASSVRAQVPLLQSVGIAAQGFGFQSRPIGFYLTMENL